MGGGGALTQHRRVLELEDWRGCGVADWKELDAWILSGATTQLENCVTNLDRSYNSQKRPWLSFQVRRSDARPHKLCKCKYNFSIVTLTGKNLLHIIILECLLYKVYLIKIDNYFTLSLKEKNSSKKFKLKLTEKVGNNKLTIKMFYF